MSLSTWLIMVLVIVVWPILFVALWLGIVQLMSLLSGWRRLGRRYGAAELPNGYRTVPNVTGMVGLARYRRVLRVTVDADGMFIEIRWIFRMGHPTLFIPWHEIRNARRMKLFYNEFVAFDIGDPRAGRMRLPAPLFDGTPVFID